MFRFDRFRSRFLAAATLAVSFVVASIPFAPALPAADDSPIPTVPTPVFPENSADASSCSERLRQLSWLVGCWELRTNGFVVRTKIDFAPGGGFVVGRYYVSPEAPFGIAPNANADAVSASDSAESPNAAPLVPQSTLAVVRVVAWNPVSELFQTTVFALDGGVGTAIWNFDGDVWRVTTRILLGNGRVATSLDYFSPRSPNGFAWESTERSIEGEPTPALGPAETRPLDPAKFDAFEKAFLRSLKSGRPSTAQLFDVGF